MLKKLLTAVGGNPTERDLKDYEMVADAISALEPEYQALTDSELRSKTDSFRDHLSRAISGITDEEARNLIQHLLEDKRVCCFEMTEINPLLDDRNKMAETAFSILKATINKINKNFS